MTCDICPDDKVCPYHECEYDHCSEPKSLQKVKRERNPKYLRAARYQQCTMRLAECNFNRETTVAAHNGFAKSGMGRKADDSDIAFMCSACHSAYDGHTKHNYSKDYLMSRFKLAKKETHAILKSMRLM